ncbi:HD family phosphohydrolase [Egicoccus sp. AB-alg2]|uniref:HD family phosphohydrolase n=1 Tax=Egicoccus sp. AB-alg2 TaxID=3242693 RepID=UPI00359D1E8A
MSTDGAVRSLLWHRVAAVLLTVVAVPMVVAVGAVADEQPVREGEPAPRTVFADERVRIVDEQATEQARATAAQSVDPVEVNDPASQAAIVADTRRIFAAVRDVRDPVDDAEDDDVPPRTLSREQQLGELQGLELEVPEEVLTALLDVPETQLPSIESATVAIAQNFARQPVADQEEIEQLLADRLPVEIAVQSLPGETAQTIVEPVIRTVMRPTVVVDPDATTARRERAAEETDEVARSWSAGQAIVREGEIVDAMQARAIEQLGLAGSSPARALLRAFAAMAMVTAVAAVYLHRMQPRVWVSGKKLLLLGLLVTAYAALVVGASALTGATSSGWSYVVPAGALAMLTALLIHPVVGIATMLPASVLVLLVEPSVAPVALFAAAAVLVSVPLTTRITSRSDLRSATLRAGLSYPVLAAVLVLVFGPRDELLTAILAGAINGLVTAVAVQGAMPFLENLFRLPTVTGLLDLADRNHPLLRELEAKALGSYNHSVMVASLCERACRAIGAQPLLGSVAALYHDIGKVRQPHFFIENQQGIANPHDDLEPEVSAVIIQNHVVDGVEMATEYRLPPEVVACIGSHHGTMLVSYFFDRAVEAAGGDASAVDEDHFRYKGHKPRSKEAAVLLLADCCEAATRAMAMSRGTLPRDEIESTVDKLLQERIDDGQFEECDLTFRELMTARDTIVESLVGIYHPRIAYPGKQATGTGEPARAATAVPEEDQPVAPVPAGEPSEDRAAEPAAEAGDEASPEPTPAAEASADGDGSRLERVLPERETRIEHTR